MKSDVRKKFDSYPPAARERLLFLRNLILDTASEFGILGDVEETLKWGEPAYVSPVGSTVRIDWKESTPDTYAMYFNCNTKLVETFRILYGDVLTLEGKRAIVFEMNSGIPVDVVRHCVSLALTYHKVKRLPLLGTVA